MAQRPVVLADSSFYISEIRQGRNPLQQLRLLWDSYEVAVCGAVCCEVGRGFKDPALRAKYHATWALMLNVPTNIRIWMEAEQLLWNLDRQGKPIPLPDALIACSARSLGAVLLSHDGHFDLVPGLATAGTIRELLGL